MGDRKLLTERVALPPVLLQRLAHLGLHDLPGDDIVGIGLMLAHPFVEDLPVLVADLNALQLLCDRVQRS